MSRKRKSSVLGPVGCLVALLSAPPLAAASAVKFCGAPQNPLLTVDSTELREFVKTIRISTFIFTDGTVVDSQVVNSIRPPDFTMQPLPVSSQIARGTASQDDLAALLSALGAARPGVAHDCHYIFYDLGDSTEYRLTWYGKAKRKNVFVANPDLTTAPDCTQEVNDLIDRIFTLRSHLLRAPATETLSSGPFW